MIAKIQKLLCMTLTVCLLAALSAAPALAASYSAWINSSSAKIYVTPSVSGSLPKGTSVSVTDTSGAWAEISYNGATGYMQLKYLTAKDGITGYVSTRTALYKSASSSSTKLGTLSLGTEVSVVGICGSYCQVTNSSGSVYGYVKTSCLSKSKPALSAPESNNNDNNADDDSPAWTSKVELIGWYDGGSGIFEKNSYGYIYDIKSGITLRVKRMGGSSHADLEPATTEDTAKLLRISGGEFNWDSHSVILRVNGRYLAAAINTMPHGEQTITDNGYEGQFCLHLLGSKTHGSDTVNTEHQTAIRNAYNWALAQ